MMPEVLVALDQNLQAGLGAVIFGRTLTGAVVYGPVANLLTGQVGRLASDQHFLAALLWAKLLPMWAIRYDKLWQQDGQ